MWCVIGLIQFPAEHFVSDSKTGKYLSGDIAVLAQNREQKVLCTDDTAFIKFGFKISDLEHLFCLPGEGQVNGTIVLDHAILAATSLGYGTCWIGAYDGSEVKAVLGIPEDHGIVCLAPVGLAAEQPEVRTRKLPAQLFARERFGSPLDYAIP